MDIAGNHHPKKRTNKKYARSATNVVDGTILHEKKVQQGARFGRGMLASSGARHLGKGSSVHSSKVDDTHANAEVLRRRFFVLRLPRVSSSMHIPLITQNLIFFVDRHFTETDQVR